MGAEGEEESRLSGIPPFHPLSACFILPRTWRRCQGRREQPWVCSEESQEITEDLDPGIPELPPDFLLPKKNGGLCFSQSSIVPDPHNRQHFLSIINLESVYQKFAYTRVSCSKCPLKEAGHPSEAWKYFHRTVLFWGCLSLL